MFSSLFSYTQQATEPTTRFEQAQELKNVAFLLKKIRSKNEKHKISSEDKANEQSNMKHIILSELLSHLDNIVNTYNTQTLLSHELAETYAQYVLVTTMLHVLERVLDDNVSMLILNAHRNGKKQVFAGFIRSITLHTSAGDAAVKALDLDTAKTIQRLNALRIALTTLKFELIAKFGQENQHLNFYDLIQLNCPVTKSVIKQPAFSLLDGVTYERSEIHNYFNTNRATPLPFLLKQGQKITDVLIVNLSVRDALDELAEKQLLEKLGAAKNEQAVVLKDNSLQAQLANVVIDQDSQKTPLSNEIEGLKENYLDEPDEASKTEFDVELDDSMPEDGTVYVDLVGEHKEEIIDVKEVAAQTNLSNSVTAPEQNVAVSHESDDDSEITLPRIVEDPNAGQFNESVGVRRSSFSR